LVFAASVSREKVVSPSTASLVDASRQTEDRMMQR